MIRSIVQICTNKEQKIMQISRHWRMKAIRYRLEGVHVNSEQTQKQAREAQREPVSLKRVATAAR